MRDLTKHRITIYNSFNTNKAFYKREFRLEPRLFTAQSEIHV